MFGRRFWAAAGLALYAAGPAPLRAADIDGNGFIRTWLILGPYGLPYGDANDDPGIANIRKDYLTDGVVTEATVMPGEGTEVDTDFGIAASTRLLSESNARMNPRGIPAWYLYTSPQDTIDHNQIFGRDVDDHVTYAAAWLVNRTGGEIPDVQVGVASDDSIQVILGRDQEIMIVNQARGYGGAGVIQNWSTRFTIPDGRTRLLVKVFDHRGGSGFRLKFQDPEGPLRSDRLEIRTDPYGSCPIDLSVESDAWLRVVTFRWGDLYPSVRILEGGAELASVDDTVREVRLLGVEAGRHRYEVVADLLSFGPRCDTVELDVDIEPAWPEEFTCTPQGEGVAFTWRNREGYYEVLKIQEGGVDVPGVVFSSNESAVLAAAAAGTHRYALVCAHAGFENESQCEVTVGGGGPVFLRGDTNASGAVDIADAIGTLTYLFGGEGGPIVCVDALDTNNDGQIDIGDAIGTLGYLFIDAAPPVSPGPEACGPDPDDGVVYPIDDFPACAYPPDVCPR